MAPVILRFPAKPRPLDPHLAKLWKWLRTRIGERADAGLRRTLRAKPEQLEALRKKFAK